MPKITLTESPCIVLPQGEGQQAVWDDQTSRNIYAEGGWGSGKSWIASRLLARNHVGNAITFDALGKPSLTGIASGMIYPTFSLAGSIGIPYVVEAFAEMGLKAEFKKSFGGYINVIVVKELSTSNKPSLIYVATADAPERITGWSASTLFCDEVTRWAGIGHSNPKLDPLMQSKGRLRGAGARRQLAIYTYTPETTGHPIVREAKKVEDGKATYRLKSKDNPAVAEMEASLRATLTPEQAAQYLDGIAMDTSNSSVYYAFDREKHLNPDARIDPASPSPICLTFDFNVSPGASLYAGQYHAVLDEFHVAHEIFFKGLDLPTVTAKALALLLTQQGGTWKHPAPLEVFADPAGSARSLATGESCHQIIRQQAERLCIPIRMRIKAAHDPVTDRLAAVNAALRDGHNKSHLFIHPSCRRLIEDFERMAYGEDGKPDKSDLSLSHASDSLGYWLAYIRPVRVSSSPREYKITSTMPPQAAPNGWTAPALAAPGSAHRGEWGA